jgi:hypothetical protein
MYGTGVNASTAGPFSVHRLRGDSMGRSSSWMRALGVLAGFAGLALAGLPSERTPEQVVRAYTQAANRAL